MGFGEILNAIENYLLTGLSIVLQADSGFDALGDIQRFLDGESVMGFSEPTREIRSPGWWRKYVSMLDYNNPRRHFYALTFEQDDVSRELELLEALVQYLNEGFVAASETGYSDMQVGQGDVRYTAEFPDIEVGVL